MRFFISALLFLSGCQINETFYDKKPLETVPYVDIEKYMGTWYEIASFPNFFQKGCTGTTATYRLKPEGGVHVLNQCFKDSLTGEKIIANGVAEVEDAKTNSKLSVSFFWPFFGEYWIIDLSPDYRYAVVSDSKRKYLWILSRTPHMDAALYAEILGRLKAKDFDITLLQKTLQAD